MLKGKPIAIFSRIYYNVSTWCSAHVISSQKNHQMIHDYFIWDLQQCNAWQHFHWRGGFLFFIFNLFLWFISIEGFATYSGHRFKCYRKKRIYFCSLHLSSIIVSLIIIRCFVFNAHFSCFFSFQTRDIFCCHFVKKIRMIISTLAAPQFTAMNCVDGKWSKSALRMFGSFVENEVIITALCSWIVGWNLFYVWTRITPNNCSFCLPIKELQSKL